MMSLLQIVIKAPALHLPPWLRAMASTLAVDGIFSYDSANSGLIAHDTLFYGPYIPLQRGLYLVHLADKLVGEFRLRLTCNSGGRLLHEQIVSSADAAILFSADTDIAQFEVVVIRTPTSKHLVISEIILNKVAMDDLSARGIVPPKLRELEKAQTAPVAENPGIKAGRNIKAGYLRGSGLALGTLVPFITHDPDWIAAVAASRGRSIVGNLCLMNIFLIIKYSEMQGNIIEFGAYRGGSSIFMATLLKRLGRRFKVYSLDTFAGMPDCDPVLDLHRAGGFSQVNLDELEKIKQELQLDNLIFIKGLFQETAERMIPVEERNHLSDVHL